MRLLLEINLALAGKVPKDAIRFAGKDLLMPTTSTHRSFDDPRE
jgi:hypothetical protein